MIWNTYNVTLKGLVTVIQAFNEKEAIILAQAEAIKEGKNYDLVEIQNISPKRG